MGKKIRIRILDVDPASGMEKFRIRDGKKSEPAFGIRDKHPGLATLFKILLLQ
jgi:hypothetical protein